LKSEKKRSREEFKGEFLGWIRSVAADVASRLLSIDDVTKEDIVLGYRDLMDPGRVFREVDDPERIVRLAGDAPRIIFVETDSVSIFPSISISGPHILDFALAMNRRFYCNRLWFDIISLNSEYIRRSSDRMLAFIIEHELEMIRLYEERFPYLRRPRPKEKQLIAQLALERSAKKLGLTAIELGDDERLMIEISDSQPLIPKPYGETALLQFLETNIERLKYEGSLSRSAEDEAMGLRLYDEFAGWRDLSIDAYALLVREIECRLKESNLGYG